MDKVCKDIVTGKRQNEKKQSLEYYIGRMVLISLISLRRLLRQRGFVSFRLLFLVTTQRVSRCSLPSLRGRGTSMSFITYVIMTSVHYVILASASLLLCLLHTQPLMSLCHYVFRSSVTMSFTYSVHYVIMSFWLLFLCYHVFYIVCPLCHSGFCLFVTLSLHTQPLMSLCYYVFCSLCTFWFHKCKVFLQTSYFVGK